MFQFEGYTLDIARHSLRTADREVALRPKNFELLRYLVENPDRLVSKEELLKAIWPNVIVTDESLTRCMSEVRQAIGDTKQTIIATVPRCGYRFTAPVARVAAGGAAAASSPFVEEGRDEGAGNDGSTVPYSTPPERSPQEEREAERVAAPSARQRDEFIAAPGQPVWSSTVATTPQSPPRLSLVVLPFINLSGDTGQDYIADVITEGLTAYLSRIRDSFVIARTTAYTYKGKAVDVTEIGRALGVRYILEGSAQQAGARVRVSAQLVGADSGAHLWADQFDAERADLLQMQDGIVTRLARALEIELAAVEAARISRTRPASLDAEDMAVRGEAIFLAHGVDRDEAEEGFALCQRVLEIDANNVRALSILAEKIATRVTTLQSTDREADILRADELASRALRSDANSYHAYHARAQVLMAQRRPEEAIAAAQRSLKFNPGFIPAYRNLDTANIYLGRAQEVIDYADKAMRLSPFDPYLAVFHHHRAVGCFMLHQDNDAIASWRRAVADNPKFSTAVAWLAAALALTGQEEEARDTLGRYFLIPGTNTRTIARWRSLAYWQNPIYLAFRERFYEGLRKAGMPEE